LIKRTTNLALQGGEEASVVEGYFSNAVEDPYPKWIREYHDNCFKGLSSPF